MDVLTVSDFRLPGGTTHSNAEEVQAQCRFGLSTELVQINGGLSAAARGLNPRIERLVRSGQVRFAPTPLPRNGTVAVVRHPATIKACRAQLGPVEVEHLVIVVNATPVDWVGKEHWRPEEVHEEAARAFGVEPWWAPISPTVRSAVEGRVPQDRLRPADWDNIIDVDQWWVDRRDRDRDRRPVVGRHSRASVQKWPDQPSRDLAYPRDGRWDVRVLGWDKVVEDVLGPPPDSWTVHRFGSRDPRAFLAELDFFVYFHHPQLVEAFGRTILEAIASGLPAILPPHFEPIFGAAALYATPDTVGDVVQELWSDEHAYRTHVTLAQALVRHRFGYQAHGRRLGELLGPDRVGPLAPAGDSPESHHGVGGGGTVLVDLSGDPALRHRALDGTVPVATLTLAGSPGRIPGWSDLLPTAEQTALPLSAWRQMAVERVTTLLRAHPGGHALVLTDGTPWPELVEAAHSCGPARFVHTDDPDGEDP